MLASAKFNLDNCVVRAPISGRTGALLVRAGNLVRASGGTALVVINQVRPILVRFAVPATQPAADPPVRREERAAGGPAGDGHAGEQRTARRWPGHRRARWTPRVEGAAPRQSRRALAGCDGRGLQGRTLVHRQRGRHDHGHRDAEGDLPEQRAARSGPGSSWRRRCACSWRTACSCCRRRRS